MKNFNDWGEVLKVGDTVALRQKRFEKSIVFIGGVVKITPKMLIIKHGIDEYKFYRDCQYSNKGQGYPYIYLYLTESEAREDAERENLTQDIKDIIRDPDTSLNKLRRMIKA